VEDARAMREAGVGQARQQHVAVSGPSADVDH